MIRYIIFVNPEVPFHRNTVGDSSLRFFSEKMANKKSKLSLFDFYLIFESAIV